MSVLRGPGADVGRRAQEVELGRLSRPSLVQQVTDYLRKHILDGGFGSDGLLPPEAKLAGTLRVSRTVVREAMRSLQAQGLVEMSQGRRTRLRPADPQATMDSLAAMLHRSEGSPMQLLQVRRPLEAEIAALAAEHATPEDTELLEAAIQQQSEARTLETKVDADILFHKRVAAATGNPVFELVLQTLAGLSRESRRHTIDRAGVKFGLEEGLRMLVEGHAKVLAAVRENDGKAARRAMLEHLDMTQRDLMA